MNTSANLSTSRSAPLLPSNIPAPIRAACYVIRNIRGYGRLLPIIALLSPGLQRVTVESFFSGPMTLDFRELVCLPIFVFGYYKNQFPQDRIMHDLVRPGMRIFDIGANIGYYTGFFSQRVGTQGRVVSVEPMPRALRLLRETASFCGPQVVICEAAIGREPGFAQLQEMQHLDTSFVQFGTQTEGRTTPVKTIDQLTDEFGTPDIIKIDVEGAELEALKGARKTLSQKELPIVMIEYIPHHAAQFGGYSLEDLLCFFPGDKFHSYRILRSGRLTEARSADSSPATNDYLIVPVSRLSTVVHG